MQSSDMNKFKLFFIGWLCCATVAAASAVQLHGGASVNVTSDTAAVAKNMAFDEARRQILSDVLRQYADVSALQELIKRSKATDLANLISSSSIDGEKLSDTTYSANVSMVLDADAVRNWLVENAVQNWLPDDTVRDVFIVSVNMSDAVNNWADLKRVARAENIDLETKYMTGNTATLELPTASRGAFTIAIREAGWRYANQDGVLRIWK